MTVLIAVMVQLYILLESKWFGSCTCAINWIADSQIFGASHAWHISAVALTQITVFQDMFTWQKSLSSEAHNMAGWLQLNPWIVPKNEPDVKQINCTVAFTCRGIAKSLAVLNAVSFGFPQKSGTLVIEPSLPSHFTDIGSWRVFCHIIKCMKQLTYNMFFFQTPLRKY